MDQTTNKAATASAIALIIGLIAGFVIGWYWYKGVCQKRDLTAIENLDVQAGDETASSTSQTASSTTLTTTYATVTGEGSITVEAQKAGSQVVVKRIEAAKPTWVALREVVNGSTGNILGARLIPSTGNLITIDLLRPTKAGQTYRLFLYQDNGDAKFDSKKDMLVTSNNNPISAEFVAK